jgi:hypothetical protein
MEGNMQGKETSHCEVRRIFLTRRIFLKGMAAAGGVTALTAVAATRITDGRSGLAVPGKSVSGMRGYRETLHIREYYRTLRT